MLGLNKRILEFNFWQNFQEFLFRLITHNVWLNEKFGGKWKQKGVDMRLVVYTHLDRIELQKTKKGNPYWKGSINGQFTM